VVLATLVTAIGILPSPARSTTTTTTTENGQTSATVRSVDGLALTLEISSANIALGNSVKINVTESNTNAKPLNESAGRSWALQGLRMDTCYSSVYPFGVAVYQGHYSTQDVSSAVPMHLFPFVPCPLFLRYISGYYFSGSSDMAIVLPGNSPRVPMTSGIAAAGNYTSGNNLERFGPGQYTVAAGDEWGAVVLLYFTVA